KDTPCQLQCWRATVIVILLFLLSALFTILIEKMIDEEPSIKISYDKNVDSVPMPNVYFTFDRSFTVYCDNQTFADCDRYFDNTDRNNTIFSDINFGNSVWYLPNGKLTFKNDRTAFIFYIYINDNTYNSLIETNNMNMIVFDTDKLSSSEPYGLISRCYRKPDYYLSVDDLITKGNKLVSGREEALDNRKGLPDEKI
ncbi:14736_t:CDS:2, partial [Cetraspora pellucida]